MDGKKVTKKREMRQEGVRGDGGEGREVKEESEGSEEEIEGGGGE